MPSIAIAELAEGIAFLAVLTSTIAHLNRGSAIAPTGWVMIGAIAPTDRPVILK
ncbi:MAG: hypothetical protein AAGE96_18015 [Cyanobacteria bacterium P01_G01_bin.19]